MTKFCSVAAMALLVLAALGPAKWQLRTGLGFQIEHFLAFFAVTSIVCLAWPRPFVVGGALMAVSPLLEGLQGLTPDRVRLCLLSSSSEHGGGVHETREIRPR